MVLLPMNRERERARGSETRRNQKSERTKRMASIGFPPFQPKPLHSTLSQIDRIHGHVIKRESKDDKQRIIVHTGVFFFIATPLVVVNVGRTKKINIQRETSIR